MIDEHKKDGKISKKEFLDKIKNFQEKDIEITSHSLFRLSEKQRKIFEGDKLKKIILSETPLEMVIQKNGNLALFYTYENNFVLKILINLNINSIYIVTFYILNKEQMAGFKDGN
ncbi:MAG: hypothetical protein WC867_05960 [Candidatus Pacearchaeota archaeon]|jgi:hypothetical protein